MNNFLIETEDTLLIQKKEEELIKKNKFQDAEISSFDIEETPLENALEALDTYGFLSNQKVIIIKNIEVLNTRVENIKDRSFDIITARGVSTVKELLKNSYQISKQNTKWVMYKGERLDEELKEALPVIKKRGLNVEKIRIESPITRTYCIISR